MKTLFICIVTSLFVTNIAMAQTVQNNQSLFQSVLDYQASQHSQDKVEYADTNDNQPPSAFIHAVLAKQGVKRNIVISSLNQIDITQHDPGEANNSLFHGALSRHYQDTH